MPGEFKAQERLFSVNLWETHPDNENDDCSTGESFETLEQAVECMFNVLSWESGTSKARCPDMPFDMVYYRNTPFVELDGPGVHGVMERPGIVKRAKREDAMDRAAERSEYAMQQGMGLGIHAYNEAMGHDSEDSPPESSEDERAYREWQRDQEREQEDRCPDCNEVGQPAGHMGCQSPQDHP